MSNIEVGEYVRTKDGRIYQANNSNDEWILSDIFYKAIVKHSKNIIDLIQEGDYVNGKKIDAILDGGFKSEDVAEKVLCFEIDFPIEKGLRVYHNYDIKSIVTKENFKEMEYRVDE